MLMFGNRMNYTYIPGGSYRRGLIYQSGGGKSKDAIGCLYNLGAQYLVTAPDSVECFIRFRKSGKISFFLRFRVRAGDFRLRYSKSMVFEIQDWVPIGLIEPIRLGINGELLDFSDIEFTTDHVKVKKETFVVTNYNDDSTYSKDALVIYLNRQDFEYEDDGDFYYLNNINFTTLQTFDIPLSGKYYIYEGKNNDFITEIDGMYYPNAKDGLIHDNPDAPPNFCYSVNWGSLRKYTESYATKFKVNYTGDWYYRPEDYYVPQYEVEHLINNERFLISNNPLIISELFTHHGIYVIDDIYNFNAFRFNNITMFHRIGGAYFNVFNKNDPLNRYDGRFIIRPVDSFNTEPISPSQPNNFVRTDYSSTYPAYPAVSVKSYSCDSYSFPNYSDVYDKDHRDNLCATINMEAVSDSFWCLETNSSQSGYLQLQSIDEKITMDDVFFNNP